MNLDWKQMEVKWQAKWEQAHIFEADLDPDKPKFFITVAYPYPNSPQHVGHGRTYTITDAYARYKRMQGFNVLFPMAFHYTGTPILAMAKRVTAGDEELIKDFITIYNVPKNKVKEFTEPLTIANYFHSEIKKGMQEIGYSIDWRREFTTIEPRYNRFIEWQFKTLREKGLITRGSHPVGWCPSCESPMGQHDTKGDMEPDIGEVTLVKFKLIGENIILPTGTLRPETLFGVTNLWIRPDIEYVHAEVNGEDWLVSHECANKLIMLNYDVKHKKRIAGEVLIGKYVENPLTSTKAIILPASFVDPKNATGIVMSVPGHAPYDYIALEDLKKASDKLVEYNISAIIIQDLKPISLISLEGYSDFPALDFLNQVGATDQSDEKVEEATKEVYNREFHFGIMKDNTGQYAGLPVSQARDAVERDLLKQGTAHKIYELLNRPIYCRCGGEVIVKIFADQWFINYGDEGWKHRAHECLDQMYIVPKDLVVEFNNVIDWLREKACARRHGMGTRLPWDKDWIIESLSDSVIYMSYYTIASILKKEGVLAHQLSDEAFDYVFLGIGDPISIEGKMGLKTGILDAMHREFIYFYPLDSRNSGRDLVPNHLTFFIYNHAAVFPKAHWPRQIVVNGSVLMEGKKMSKSFGNIIPLRTALGTYHADPLRVAILSTAELLQDADFSTILARSIKERLERFYAFTLDVISEKGEPEEPVESIGIWLLSRLQQHIKTVTKAMDSLRFRQALQTALYIVDQDVQWYLRRRPQDKLTNAQASNILRQVLEVKVLLLAPFTPHLSEEIWYQMGKPSFVSTTPWPTFDVSKVDKSVLVGEEIVKSLQDDISHILQATKISPRTICLYAAAKWKWYIYREALKLADQELLDVSRLMKALMTDPQYRKHARDVSAFVQKIVTDMRKTPKNILQDRLKTGNVVEFDIMSNARAFYAREWNADVRIYAEDDESLYDPQHRARLAEPYRPAIYIE